MKQIITSLIISLIFFLLEACHTSKHTSTVASARSEILYKQRWIVDEVQGQNLKVASENVPHLLLIPGQMNKVYGSTGCNKFNGSFQLTGNNLIKFSPLVTTKMACVATNVESTFLDALSKATKWSIINNQLILSDDIIILMRLKAMISEAATLDGTWELNYISGPRIAFNGLYPDKKPTIKFNIPEKELGGNTSCNGFSSKIITEGNKILIAEPFAKTMIFCEGGGETTFLIMLKKVNRYAVTNNSTLTFLIGDVAVMRFTKI